MNNLYKTYIYNRCKLLLLSKEINLWDNRDLAKIFEYYSCIRLSEQLNRCFKEYNDICPEFKENNDLSRNDSGIDACDEIDSIVQCKLRKDHLTWNECSTFFASQNIHCKVLKKTIIRWDNLFIVRNDTCKLSANLQVKKNLFHDITFQKNEILEYCQNILNNPPIQNEIEATFQLRDYQQEAINLIQTNHNSNTIINLPTGTGKNIVIIHSLIDGKKYLILVPRIILMEQIKDEIIKFKPHFKNKIQCIGNNQKKTNVSKDIIICVYNSIGLIPSFDTFEKIFVDEAHHIAIPTIYFNSFEENSDDSDKDDEDSYIDKISMLKQFNNNVYLSATIDNIDGFVMYKKDIREMIELSYICDYTIHIPIFSNNQSDEAICSHLIENYTNIIIYCSSQEEGKKINTLMNTRMKGCSEYIDCNTPTKKRNDIIKKFKQGELNFLVNVRILIEGFDAPITKGVCFMHLPSNQTTLIQIIGRALRKHKDKTYANIILPFSNKDDEDSICHFMKIMSNNDTRIRKSYIEKKIGGYISLEKKKEEDIETNDNFEIDFRYNMIFDSFGKCLNGIEIWMKKFEELKNYIKINKKTPPARDKIGSWVSTQKKNYKKKQYIMKEEEIYVTWTNFMDENQEYFEDNVEKWMKNFEELKNYIKINKKTPPKKEKLGNWFSHQKQNYKKKQGIMKEEEIYDIWTKFMDENQEYFDDNVEIWKKKFEELNNYIVINKKSPPSRKNKLGNWLQHQKQNYKKKQQIMKEEDIYDIWTKFMDENQEYLQ